MTAVLTALVKAGVKAVQVGVHKKAPIDAIIRVDRGDKGAGIAAFQVRAAPARAAVQRPGVYAASVFPTRPPLSRSSAHRPRGASTAPAS